MAKSKIMEHYFLNNIQKDFILTLVEKYSDVFLRSKILLEPIEIIGSYWVFPEDVFFHVSFISSSKGFDSFLFELDDYLKSQSSVKRPVLDSEKKKLI